MAAPAPASAERPPARGWVAVSLPDTWVARWPEARTVWYRLQWHYHCNDRTPPLLALAASYMNMAASVYLNGDLLWHDRSLHEPFSRSWNMPRLWFLHADALNDGGTNVLLFRITGPSTELLGLGAVRLGDAASVRAWYDTHHWQKRTLYQLNAIMSGTLGTLFLLLWVVRREEKAYGWYGLASLAWTLFSLTLLATSPWPFDNSADWSCASILAFVLYCHAFCHFVWSFGEQSFPRLSRACTAAVLMLVAGLWWLPVSALGGAVFVLLVSGSLMIFGCCIQFQFHAWRRRRPHEVLLALCLLFYLVVGVRDLLIFLGLTDSDSLLTPYTSPIAIASMFLVVAARFANNLKRIEGFNDELKAAIASTRTELTNSLQKKHQLEASNLILEARLRLSHDLHDGFGSALVRSIAIIEQCNANMEKARFLSILKNLRADLRQVIEHTASRGHTGSAEPGEWIAPLRRRFASLFDEMDVTSRWHLVPVWPCRLSSVQQLALTRFVEEALSNVIKHSRCSTVEVRLDALAGNGLRLTVRDDGVGFDRQQVLRRHGIGMQSMPARIARIGGLLDIQSAPGCTCLTVTLRPGAPGALPAEKAGQPGHRSLEKN